jgi:flagellar biosynthesis GTPase FlhF
MMIIDKDNFHLLPTSKYDTSEGYIQPKIAARIEPGNAQIREDLKKLKSLNQAIEQGKGTLEKQPTEEEMLVMTKAVLASNTVYRAALASNVRAFYKAVVNEGEMEMLRDEIAEMKEGQKRIEEMLRSLGAVEQKRDSAA